MRHSWLVAPSVFGAFLAALANCSSFGEADAPASLDAAVADVVEGGPGDDGDALGDAGAEASAYATEVFKDSPLLYWRMDISSGSSVPNAASSAAPLALIGDGYRTGAAGITADKGDHAVDFEEAGRATSASMGLGVLDTNAFTVECWAQQRTKAIPGAFSTIWSRAVPAAAERHAGVLLYLSSDTHPTLEWGDGQTSMYATGAAPVNLGVYHHFVATFDGNSLVLWVDGESVNGTRATTPDSGGSGAATTFELARDVAYSTGQFDGLIDEVAIYDKVLSDDRIQAHRAAR